MEEDNINVFELVLNALNSEGLWFTQKTDPTYQEASSYYVLDEYGDPTEKTIAKIEKEVKSLIGDGAVDITDAIDLWKNDQMIEARLDFVDNLVTEFKAKPVVDGINAYENSVQLSESKKVESIDILDTPEYNDYLKYELEKRYNEYCRKNGEIDFQEWLDEYSDAEIEELEDKYLANLDESKKVESKTKKTEGAGAGYHISGTINVNNINSFKVINQEEPDKYGDTKATVECDIDVTLSEMSASSYYYGNDINVDVPAKVTGLVVAISSDDEPNDIGVDEGSIKVLLDGTKFKTLIGGGWTHTTFTGGIQATDRDIADKEYYFSYFTEIDIQIPDENIVKYIDKVVEGENFFTEFLVYDQDGDIISDEFTAEETDYSAVDKAQDDAIEFAKANKGVRVVKQTYRELADGDLDGYDTEPEVVWEREYNKNYKFDDEVEESKEVKTEAKPFNEVIYGCFDRDGELLIDFKDKEEAIKYFEEHDEVDSVKEIINNYDGSEVDQTIGKEVYPTLEESKKVKDEQQAELDAYVDELDECTKVKVETKSFGKALRELKLEANTELTSEQKVDKIANIGSLIDKAKYPFQLTAVIHTLGFIDQDLSNKLKQQYNPTTIKQDGIEEAREGIAKIIYDDTGVDVLASNIEFATESKDVNFKQCTKDKKVEDLVDNFYTAFEMHGFRRRINEDTTIEELINELYNFITFENISQDDIRKAIRDIVNHINVQFNANLDPERVYLWYINGNYGGTYEKVRKNKITEDYQKRLEEVSNKSANTISDMLQAEDFDENSNAGKIILRTQDLFTTLSDLGLNVDVTFDNGDSTTTVQLGTAGGKVIITINDPNKPLKAFMSGNVEITGDSLDKFKTIEDRIKTV